MYWGEARGALFPDLREYCEQVIYDQDWRQSLPLSAPSICSFSHGVKKSITLSVPSSLIFMCTAASSKDLGGWRPGTGVPCSWEAYPLPLPNLMLPASSDVRPPPDIQMPPPLTVFGSGPASVVKTSTIPP